MHVRVLLRLRDVGFKVGWCVQNGELAAPFHVFGVQDAIKWVVFYYLHDVHPDLGFSTRIPRVEVLTHLELDKVVNPIANDSLDRILHQLELSCSFGEVSCCISPSDRVVFTLIASGQATNYIVLSLDVKVDLACLLCYSFIVIIQFLVSNLAKTVWRSACSGPDGQREIRWLGAALDWIQKVWSLPKGGGLVCSKSP